MMPTGAPERDGGGVGFWSLLKLVWRRVRGNFSQASWGPNGGYYRLPHGGTMHFYLSTGNAAMVLMLTGGTGA
jgi:hypothetical protein